ncbi:unnamed protein product [Paramecium pentaurelia]|uniref:Uncharacterized protein n=1 Tax=Paramecium pentaurelia TaxID=43138 RepID=A0A8S1S5W0_9CILI|nr:unnamed protein product [Paramecium pentaurelia]
MIKTQDDKIQSQQFGQYVIFIYEENINQLPEGFKEDGICMKLINHMESGNSNVLKIQNYG